ncbi:kinesin family member 2/24 [Fistulifera solaris]|uniref:Kinesin-like protein n=1 Tax=Fistulifera solaris TaxID=1519565 RepID=A0A1Z5J6K0_FISSO|nr:kinesin family member 2/24 [Fistulifera solaris]|eukprot:GAX09401.1 kinesin family member 2/24 [Fistulifera solaris]
MNAEREERRRTMLERKKARAQEEQRNIAAGNPGDVDFIGMVREWRATHADQALSLDACQTSPPKICICVRKRPISDKERNKNDHDSVTCLNPEVWIHSAKLRVDGITKYLDHTSFQFDYTFNEDNTTEDVYNYTTLPLIDFVCSGHGGRATVFAYGQTGSGKTYTMSGIQNMMCEDLYFLLNSADSACTTDNTNVMVSFFELYGGYVQDLLNNRNRVKVLEDGKGEVVITGLTEVESDGPNTFLEILRQGNSARTTHMTEANDASSRSHAICQIMLRDAKTNKLKGKLSLVDLAGSERGSDTKSHNSQRRAESSDINTSLLSLKECIRALDRDASKHVPYRGSKLTLILKDCFTSDRAMTTMIATVSPGASAADHSLNTLRYADRIKEKRSTAPTLSPRPLATTRMRRPSAMTNQHLAKAKAESPVHEMGTNQSRSMAVSRTEMSATTIANGDLDLTEENQSRLESETADDDLLFSEDEKEEPTKDDELNQTVRELFEEEEGVLNMHMTFIAENAKLLSKEGALLQDVQRPNVSDEEIERYASMLEEILDRKEDMIAALQRKLAVFESHLDAK